MYRSSEHLHQLKTIKKNFKWLAYPCISHLDQSITSNTRLVSQLRILRHRNTNLKIIIWCYLYHHCIKPPPPPLPLPPFPLTTSLFFPNSSSDLSRLTSCLVASATKHASTHTCTCTCRHISFKCLFPSSLSLR